MPDWMLVLTLIISGFILLLIELLIIPGFGLIGILGLLSLAAASYIAYTRLNLALGIITSLGSLILIVLSLRLFPKTGFWRRLTLERAETRKEGFQSFLSRDSLLGKEGNALTPLRPSGTAVIEGKRVDVVTEGTFIPKGVPLKVIKVEGGKVIVRTKQGGG